MPSEQELRIQAELQKNNVKTLFELVGSMSVEMGSCTAAMRDLTTQFAVYTEKHDNTDKTMQAMIISQTRMHDSITEHSIAIAMMKPTVESVRGLVWKVLTSLILGMGGMGVLVSVMVK